VNVFIVIPTLRAGGAESVVVTLANSIVSVDRDINCTVLTIFDDHDTDYFLSSLSNEVNVINLGVSLKSKLYSVYKLFNVFRVYKPDIVHTHLTAFYYSFLPCFLMRIKFIHTVHTQPKIEFSGFRKYICNFISILVRPKFVCLNHKLCEDFQKIVKIKCFTIENGSRDLGVVKRNRNRNFVILARFDPVKRHDLLIKAFTSVAQNTSRKLYIIGVRVPCYNDYYENLKKLCHNKKNIFMLENLSTNEDLSRVFSDSQFVILSSKYEGLPVSLLEGMSTGLIPVSTPNPGLLDFFHKNKLCYQSASDDVNSLSETIRNCIDLNDEAVDKDSSHSLGVFSSNYSSTTMAKNYLFLYKNLGGNNV
jgi:glycosyltransferase involved in cell wall biosynthesis